MTVYLDLFKTLAVPFDPREIKYRSIAGVPKPYITARSVMNRLDAVLGPQGWWDSYEPRENSVLCRLTVQLPDGSTLTKSDAGGYAGMADTGDDDKSGYSDAFKRAAVKFGVGRHLYGDGVVDYEAQGGPWVNLEGVTSRNTAPAPKPATEAPRGLPGPPSGQLDDFQGKSVGAAQFSQKTGQYDNFRKPTFGKAMFPWTKNLEQYFQVELLKHTKSWAEEVGAGWKMADWTEDQVSAVADKVIEFLKDLPTYKGEFGAVVANPDPRQSVSDESRLRESKDKLINKLTQLFVKQNGGHKPEPDQLRQLLATISPLAANFEGSTGEVATSLRSMTDVTWVENIFKLVDRKLVELVMVDEITQDDGDDIPF